MDFRGFKKATALLFLVISMSAFGYEDVNFEDDQASFRIKDECGCRKGSLLLYSVDHNGTSHERVLSTYGTQEACEDVLRSSPPSECR